MKNILLSLIMGCCLLSWRAGFSQTMSNTGSTITLTGTCMLTSNGAYTLNLAYVDPDNGYTTVPATSATVSSGGGVITITVGITLPTPSGNGYWSLPDADNGSISLTGGPSNGIIYWYHNPDGSIAFNCVPLPIYFSNISGSQSGSHINLSWQTQTEQNTSVIEIYRSTTATNLYKIGQVTAAGVPSSYSFTDNNPDGTNWYRLKMLKSDGTPAIWSIFFSVSCSGCTYTPPTAVNCNFSINGPDHICNLETPTAYSLSSPVPNYSTITWSVDDPSAAHVSTYPDFDRTQVTLLRKSGDAPLTLKATLSGCSNVISKKIIVGAPAPALYQELACPVVAGYVITPGATSWTWTLLDQFTSAQWVTVSTDDYYGDGYNSWSGYIGDGDYYVFNVFYTNVCGTSPTSWSYSGYYCDPNAYNATASPGVQVYPNPSSGVVTIGAAAAGSKSVVKGRARVYQVKVMDVQGALRKTFSYPGGVEQVSVDLSGLANGIYIIQVYDNKTWTSRKMVLTR